MAKVNFYLREPGGSATTPVVMFVHFNSQRAKIGTNETILPKFWDTSTQRPRKTASFPEHPEFKTRLDKLEALANDVLRRYQNDNEQQFPTREEFRLLMEQELNRTAKPQTVGLFEFIEQFIKESENRLNSKGKPLGAVTIRDYRRSLTLLQGYRTKYFKRKPFSFEHVEGAFYEEYRAYLMKDCNFATNTVGKHIKMLKTFLNEAHARGLMDRFISRRFKVVTENTDSIYLDAEELATLFALDLSEKPRIERVRDLFLVGCWTGLRFSDFTRITSGNFFSDATGDYIEIVTQKTTEPVVIPVHPTIRAVRERYKGKTPNSLPPPISNVKMNEYLKELGRLAGMDEPVSESITKAGQKLTRTYPKYELITTHTARRSFATNQYLAGIPTYVIMAITGHRTEKAFLRYIKITPRQHAQTLRKLWDTAHSADTQTRKGVFQVA